MNEPPQPRRFQFRIKSLLTVTVIVALTMAMAATPDSLGSLILGLMGIPILLVFLSVWNRWSWRIGLLILFVLSVVATPPRPC